MPDFYNSYMAPELGVVENVQLLLNLVTAVLGAVLLSRPEVRAASWLRVWAALIVAGAVYVAGEEASWGQHLLGWSTPDGWAELNDQQETNLHNVSSWFDQKPRLLLEIGILVGALALPLLGTGRLDRRWSRIGYLVPSVRCVPAAAMVLVARIGDWLADLGASALSIFYRPAEVHELFMYTVLVIYTSDLIARVRRVRPPA